jgi:hypothetical protein
MALVALLSAVVCDGMSVAGEPVQGSVGLLSFDEIGRVHIKPPAPAPESFGPDAARIASLPPFPDSKAVFSAFEAVHALGMNPVTAFAVAPAAIAANAALKANQARLTEVSQEYLNAGIMTHEWFHRDWARTEVPAFRRASITRPDLGAAYFLDLAKHTYRETHAASPASPSEETYTVSAADDVMITFVKAPVHRPLGVMTLGGIAARGFQTEATFTLPGLLGWCSSGRHGLVEVEYVSDLTDPQAPSGSPLEGSQWVREACMPTSAGSHRVPGRLVVFRSTAFTGDGANDDFVNVLERGNVRTAEQYDTSLFAVPAGFTKVELK